MPNAIKESVYRQFIKPLFFLIFGSILSGLAINIFYIPIKLTMGGVSGIASIIYQLTGQGNFLSFGVLVVILNIPLLILGWWKVGLKFVWKSIVGTAVYSMTLDICHPLVENWFQNYINVPLANSYPDPLIFCIFGGILYGISMGMILKGGYTTGGTDILGVVIHRKFRNISIGKILMFLDLSIVLATLFFYRGEDKSALLLVMYSFVAMYFTSKFTDVTLEGLDYSKVAYIITEKHELIANQIFIHLERGATLLNAKGLYSGQERGVIYCVLSNRQVPKLKEIVQEADSKAFVVVSEAKEVLGEGFERDTAEFL